MNVGVQFLREHIIPEARIHYAITDTGGYSPNVVQPKAEVLYLMRAPTNRDVKEIYERVCDIARGAALMTGTQLDIRFIKACSSIVHNCVLTDVLQKNMEAIPCPVFDEEENAFAAELQATFGKTMDSLDRYANCFDAAIKAQINSYRGKAFYDFVMPLHPVEGMMPASSDVGDASWCCPVAEISVATMAARTSFHSWQLVAQGKSSFAHKGACYAGKVLAAAAVDLLEQPELLKQAKAEHWKRIGEEKFISPIPQEVQPFIPGRQ